MNMAMAIIKDEIVRFGKCKTLKKLVNHTEYIKGMIDMATRIGIMDSCVAKELTNETMAAKKQQMDNIKAEL